VTLMFAMAVAVVQVIDVVPVLHGLVPAPGTVNVGVVIVVCLVCHGSYSFPWSPP
jgi:hypothetical protein